jgi:hypothetical protein
LKSGKRRGAPTKYFLLIKHDDAGWLKPLELWTVPVDLLRQHWRDYSSRMFFLLMRDDRLHRVYEQ